MLPSAGHIFFCPFTDENLYNETDQKVRTSIRGRSHVSLFHRLNSSMPPFSVSFCSAPPVRSANLARNRLPGTLRCRKGRGIRSGFSSPMTLRAYLF